MSIIAYNKKEVYTDRESSINVWKNSMEEDWEIWAVAWIKYRIWQIVNVTYFDMSGNPIPVPMQIVWICVKWYIKEGNTVGDWFGKVMYKVCPFSEDWTIIFDTVIEVFSQRVSDNKDINQETVQYWIWSSNYFTYKV